MIENETPVKPKIDDKDIDLNNKADFIKGKIDNAINKMRINRNRNKKMAIIIKMANIFFTGITTILLGLTITGYAAIQKELAFIFASLATLINAIEPYFTYRALWVQHELAQWKLHELFDELEYYIAGTLERGLRTEKLDSFYNRYIEIWGNLSETWIEHRKRAEY